MWNNSDAYPMKNAEKRFCSASATALRRLFLEIYRLAWKTPPTPGGSKAENFAQNPNLEKRPVWPTVSGLSNKTGLISKLR